MGEELREDAASEEPSPGLDDGGAAGEGDAGEALERADQVADDGELPGAPDAEVDDVAALRTEREDLLRDLQRVQADFENFRKRMLREQTAHVERATDALVEQLLPVLDAFDLALLSFSDSDDAEEETPHHKLRKGVELVYSELLGSLEKNGLERIEAVGRTFDPNEHEAVMQVESPEGPGGDPVVVDVLRPGYRLKGRVLRPAMVKVAR